MEKRTHNKFDDARSTRRDNVLAAFLFAHKGENNAVRAKEIADYLNNCGYATKVGTVQSIVNRVAEQRHLPICADNKNGYYWAGNAAELQAYISFVESRASALQKHADRLKAFILE